MRAVIQRVKSSRVKVNNEMVGQIGPGLLVLLGVKAGDGEKEVDYLVDKVVNLRIFSDDEGKMNRSLLDVGGELLVVSQFTLYGDSSKGRRPSYTQAAPPELAESLYQKFVEKVKGCGVEVATGRFRVMMDVELVNDGPVTLILESG